MKLTLSLSILLLLTAPAKAQDLVAAFQRISPSIGALYSQSEDGTLRFNCTVTVVEKNAARSVLVTAYHCMRKDIAYMVTFDGRRFYSARVWMIPHDELDKQKYPRHYGEPKTDMTLLVVDEPVEAEPVPLAETSSVPSGRRIVVVGFPLGVTKVHYEGIVSGKIDRSGSDLHGYVILQTFGSPGSSGSAVIDVEARAIVAVLIGGAQSPFSGMPVLFATPVEYRKYLLEVPQGK